MKLEEKIIMLDGAIKNALAERDIKKSSNPESSYGLFVKLGLLSLPKTMLSYTVRCTKQSQFLTASLSKQRTCDMFLRALDRKYSNQNLKDLINKSPLELFKNYKTLEHINHEWLKSITIYDIMTNRSGLIWSEEILNKHAASPTFNPQMPPYEAIKFDPSMSKKYQYSGVNYFILAELIKEMTNLSFEEAFVEFVTRSPSTYSRALQGSITEARKSKDFKNLVADIGLSTENMYLPEGSANIVSTAADLIRWNRYLCYSYKMEPKFEEIMMMRSPRDETTDYGMGLIHNKNNDLIWHTGAAGNFRSWSGYMRSRDLNIVVLSNDPIKYHLLVGIVDDILLG